MVKGRNRNIKLRKDLLNFFSELDKAIKKYRIENLVLIRDNDIQRIYIVFDDGKDDFFCIGRKYDINILTKENAENLCDNLEIGYSEV